jgi:CheY-like chemotaxis protein
MKAQRKKILVADCHEDVLIVLEKLLEDAGFRHAYNTDKVRTTAIPIDQPGRPPCCHNNGSKWISVTLAVERKHENHNPEEAQHGNTSGNADRNQEYSVRN